MKDSFINNITCDQGVQIGLVNFEVMLNFVLIFDEVEELSAIYSFLLKRRIFFQDFVEIFSSRSVISRQLCRVHDN